jgi:hypothetical protein
MRVDEVADRPAGLEIGDLLAQLQARDVVEGATQMIAPVAVELAGLRQRIEPGERAGRRNAAAGSPLFQINFIFQINFAAVRRVGAPPPEPAAHAGDHAPAGGRRRSGNAPRPPRSGSRRSIANLTPSA